MIPLESGGGDLGPTPLAFGAMNLGVLDADPGTANLGDFYYNSATSTVRFFNGSWVNWQAASGSGTVSSVGLSLPGIFTVTGSPVTSSGTLTGSLASQTKNYVFAAPIAANGTPTFRALDLSDMPAGAIFTGYTGNNLWSGANTYQPSAGTTIPITVQQSSGTSQSVNLFQIVNVSSSPLFTVDANGAASHIPDSGVALTVDARNALTVASKFYGATGSNSQEWYNAAGSRVAYMQTTGNLVPLSVTTTGVAVFGASGTFGPTSKGYFSTGADATLGLIVRGNYSGVAYTQTGDLQRWVSTVDGLTHTTLASISANGQLTVAPASGTAATINAASSAVGLVVKVNGADGFRVRNAADTTNIAFIDQYGNTGFGFSSPQGATLSVSAGAASQVGVNVRAVANQTSDIQQWQNSSSTVLGGRNANAQLFTGSTTGILSAVGGATSGTSSGTTATMTTASAHNLSSGDLVTIAGVTPSGYNGTYVATVTGSTTYTVTTSGSNLGNTTVSGTTSVPAQASVTARSAGTIGLVVRQSSSVNADFVQFQNNSGSTTFSKIDASGNMFATGFRSGTSYFRVDEASSGATVQLKKLTAAAGLPGAVDYAKLYLRDGTNAGTLKLVIRAGTAGAETTILDNIPQ